MSIDYIFRASWYCLLICRILSKLYHRKHITMLLLKLEVKQFTIPFTIQRNLDLNYRNFNIYFKLMSLTFMSFRGYWITCEQHFLWFWPFHWQMSYIHTANNFLGKHFSKSIFLHGEAQWHNWQTELWMGSSFTCRYFGSLLLISTLSFSIWSSVTLIVQNQHTTNNQNQFPHFCRQKVHRFSRQSLQSGKAEFCFHWHCAIHDVSK